MKSDRKRSTLRPLLLVFSWLLSTPGSRANGFSTCDISEIETCLRHVEPFTRHADTIFPTYDDRTLGDVCHSFKLMEDCLAPIKPACSHAERQMYEGIEKANDYLCGTGLQQYRNYRVCFANAALTKDGNNCNFTYAKEMEKTRNSNKEPLEERAKKLCRDTDEFMKCVKKAVLRHCGDDAASWVHNINIKVFSPLLDGIGCHDHRTSGRSNVPIAIILGVALAVISILASVVITSILCRRRQRRENAMSLNRHTISGSVEDKKLTKTDMFSQDRASERKANIYSSSPRKKVATVNGNMRKAVTDENSDSEKLLGKDGSIKDEQSPIGSPKDGTDSGTYEQIVNNSPVKTPTNHEGDTKEDNKALTVWPLPVKANPEAFQQATESVGIPQVVHPSDASENEELLPSGVETWKSHESDLDSEGFPPPPPPICMDSDDHHTDTGEGHSQGKVKFVTPYGGVASYKSEENDDLDQTVVKQVAPPMRHKRLENLSQDARNSSLYEEEVDRLLEKDTDKKAAARDPLDGYV